MCTCYVLGILKSVLQNILHLFSQFNKVNAITDEDTRD